MRFLLVFLAIVAAGVALLELDVVERGFVTPWTVANTKAAAFVCNVVGVETTVSRDTYLQTGTTTLEVQNACNGVHAVLIFVAAVLAFPGGGLAKLWGIVGGTVLMFGANLVRLVNLVVVARFAEGLLEFFHLFVWQTLIVVLAFALFAGWSRYFVPPPVRPAERPAR